MAVEWSFSKLGEGVVAKTSHEEEFFNNTSGVEALVREAAQNSMDATVSEDTVVTLRIEVGRCPPSKDSSDIFKGLQEHLKASGIGLSGSLGEIGIPFLVIEDFGTTGLGGDVAPGHLAVNKGDFYNFWWSDGTMKKGGKRGGRWGLGKYTFFMASRIKSFWGLTVNDADNKSYLMGRSLLKTHQINGSLYNIDGFYSDRFYPLTDENSISKFQTLFSLRRKNEKGLSMIIPFPEDDITQENIERAVMEHCLYPIVSGKIKIELQNGVCLDNVSLPAFIKDRTKTDSSYSLFEELMSFFTSCHKQPPDLSLSIPKPDLPEITEESFIDSLLNKSHLDDIRTRFNKQTGSFIKVRVPVRVRYKSGSANDTHFDVCFYRKKNIEKQKVFCFRSGISVIAGIRHEIRGGYAALIAEDPKIAEFLGDAENPSHTEWKNNETLSEKYSNPKVVLKFITDSVRQITNVLDKAPETVYNDILSDVFFVEEEKPEGPRKRRKQKIPKLHRTPSILEIKKKTGGFTLRFNPEMATSGALLPQHFRIMVAYMVRRGNPFSKYEITDFDLTGSDVSISVPVGGRLVGKTPNQLEVEISSPSFSVHVTGFDPKRDLAVKAVKQQAVIKP